MAYDLDGTKGFISRNVGNDFTPLELPQPSLSGLNSEKSKGLWVSGSYWDFAGSITTGQLTSRPQFIALVFPTPQHIRGVFIGNRISRTGTSAGSPFTTRNRLPAEIQTSQDTTNGLDGVWVTIGTSSGPPSVDTTNTMPGYVRAVDPSGLSVDPGSPPCGVSTGSWYRENEDVSGYGWKAVAGAETRHVRGIRAIFTSLPLDGTGWSQNGFGAFQEGVLLYLHVYGEPDDDADPDRLEFVTDDGASVMDFSWGDVHTGQEEVKQFRVRNLSTQDAVAVDLSFAAPTPLPAPSPHTGMEFSLNGVTYSSALSLSNIPSGSDSDTIYVRLIVPGPGLMGPWGTRILAEVGSWV